MTANGQTINEVNTGSKYKNKDYVRVTKALGQLDKGEELIRWMINSFKTFDEYQESLRSSAERGRDVDSVIKELLKGNEPEIKDEHTGYVEAFKKWQSEWTFVLESSDEEVSDDEIKAVGTLDLYGALKNGSPEFKKVVIDIKTGKPTRNKDGSPKYSIYPNMHWQTAAYRSMKSKSVAVDENWILRLFNDGQYRFEPDKNYNKSVAIFRKAVEIAHLRKK